MGDWAESTYTETRFGGMDASHEAHTLDRDGGLMADIFNMETRTQALRTRGGYRLFTGIGLRYSPPPGWPKSVIGLIPFETNLTVDSTEGPDDEGGSGSGGITPVVNTGDTETDPRHRRRRRVPESDPPVEDDPDVPDLSGSFEFDEIAYIVCDVPRTVRIGRTGQAYSGRDAEFDVRLGGSRPSWNLSRGITTGWSGNSWAASLTVSSRSRAHDQVRLEVSRPGETPCSMLIPYTVGNMVPDISEFDIDEISTWTIAYRYGENVQTGYAGGGAGLVFALSAYDALDGELQNAVEPVGQYWQEGVCHGRYIVTDPQTAKVKLTAVFAGETISATAYRIPYRTMLAEAINERLLAKTGTAGTYTGSEPMTALSTAAKDCMVDYMKTDVDGTGNYTLYTAANTGIETSQGTMTDEEWAQDCYTKVITAKKQLLAATPDASQYLYIETASRSDSVSKTKGQDDSWEEVRSRAVSDISLGSWGDWSRHYSGWVIKLWQTVSHDSSSCTAMLYEYRMRMRLVRNVHVSCVVRVYAVGMVDGEKPYDVFGSTVFAEEGKYVEFFSYAQAAGAPVQDSAHTVSTPLIRSGFTSTGCEVMPCRFVLDYDFRHKEQ